MRKKQKTENEMKVLYDSQAFDMQTHGGVSRCFAELYSNRPESVDARIGVLESDNVYLQQLGFPKNGNEYDHFLHKGFPMRRIIYKAYKNIKGGYPEKWDRKPRVNQLESEHLLRMQDFDVFHPTFFDDYFLRFIGKKPFVLTIHDMIPELFPKYYSKKEKQIVLKKKLAGLAAHIVAVSEQTKTDIVHFLQIPEEKVSVVYHGSDTKPYYPSVGTNYTFEYLLYVGERHWYKNFTGFCRDCMPILRRHKDLKIVCTGRPFTPEELFFFEAFGMEERFIHLFVEDEQDFMDLYHNAIAFVYPSSYEGFGIPILEAYKAGCPVMLNKASCFPEIAADAAIYFEMKKDSSDFEEQFENLYHMSSEERKSLIEKQKKRLALFSWKTSADELAKIYQKVI